jgi:WD40 repeat protein
MRDDFYPQLAADAPALLTAFAPGLVNVPATLGIDELRDIIVKPADTVGLRFEDNLPDRIIGDVLSVEARAAVTRKAPVSALPLLELTLEQLWRRRRGAELTHEAYQRIGGVAGAITTWCDAALDQLPTAQRRTAQQILTALVRPADDTRAIPAVRQQLPIAVLRELARPDAPRGDGDETAHTVDQAVLALTAHRIVITRATHDPTRPDEPAPPVAELVHDALIRDWSTLRDWVSQDHRFQDWLRRVREQHTRWAEHHNPDDLLHGTDLAEGEEWSTPRRLPLDIAAFLAASRQRHQTRTRRARRLNIVLASLLAAALVATGVALWQRQAAVTARQAAISAQRVSLSRQLAAQGKAIDSTDPVTARRLAAAAWRIAHTDEARDSLLSLLAEQRSTLYGHTGAVNAVAFSPDSSLLATASSDQTTRLWNPATGRPVGTPLTGHTGAVNAAAFGPDGRLLATAGDDWTVRLWNTATGLPARKPLWGHDAAVLAVAFSPDGRLLATAGDDRTVRLWNTATGAPVRPPLTGHTDAVTSVAFSPDGRQLATGSYDGTVRLWTVATGAPADAPITYSVGVRAVAFSPDGRQLAVARGGEVLSRDLATGKEVYGSPTVFPESNLAVAFNPGGTMIATASGDHSVRLWSPANGGEYPSPLTSHTGAVNSVAFSPNGRWLATGSADRTVRLWDAATARPAGGPLAGHTSTVTVMAFSPDGQTLATGSNDNSMRLWDPATNESWRLSLHIKPVSAVAIRPDGQQAASASTDGEVLVIDTDKGTPRRELRTWGLDPPQALAFDARGRLIATDGDRYIWSWNPDTDEPATVSLQEPPNGTGTASAFSPDAHLLATASSDNAVHLWNPQTGQPVGTPLTGHTDTVTAVAFTPDGSLLATASKDRTVRLWDPRTGQPVGIPLSHVGAVTAAAFSLNGPLATAADDHEIRLWDLSLFKDPIRSICTEFGPIGPNELRQYVPAEQVPPDICS